jgi:esterase/lipase superfamily enzyme
MNRRVALLVVNEDFPASINLEPLRGSVAAVRVLAQQLRDPQRGGFEVVHEFVDSRRREIGQAISEALEHANFGDVVLIYYSGYLISSGGGEIFLATADTDSTAIHMTSVEVQFIDNMVLSSRCDSVMLIFDCIPVRGESGSFDREPSLLLPSLHRPLVLFRDYEDVKGLKANDNGVAALARAISLGIASGDADLRDRGEIRFSDIANYVRATTGLISTIPQAFRDGRPVPDPIISRYPTSFPREAQERLEANEEWAVRRQLEEREGAEHARIADDETRRLDEELKRRFEEDRHARERRPREPQTDVDPKPEKEDLLGVAGKGTFLIWYGTNRRPVDPADSNKGYTADRDTSVHYGTCRVFIPASHRIGSVGSPWWRRWWTWNDDRLRIRSITRCTQESYWLDIVSHLASLGASERHALIFIHGYNVSFNDAALRAAQIGFDLGVRGAMAFFSWPSQGTLGGYNVDEATIEASEIVITDFISDFAKRSAAAAVHIIGHSMGNRGLMRAIGRIAAKAERQTGKPFSQIILAAADVDADTFRQFSASYAEVCARTTLYVSRGDLAVEASRWLHKFPRVGLTPPTVVLPGIDTINVTNADLTLLGHGYVAEARDVLHDMHVLIRHGAPPSERFGLREATNEEGKRFWLIGA